MAQEEFTDAIAMLKADHRKVEELFSEFENAKGRKQAIADQICNELKIHSMLEEEIFYPAFQGKIEQEDLDEAYVEHDAAKVLKEEIEHHVEEEEKRGEGIFAQCRGTDVDLIALRDQMLLRKEELVQQSENGGLPPAQTTTMETQPA
jgi:hemerythrin superfamily protein